MSGAEGGDARQTVNSGKQKLTWVTQSYRASQVPGPLSAARCVTEAGNVRDERGPPGGWRASPLCITGTYECQWEQGEVLEVSSQVEDNEAGGGPRGGET